jgi:hypothetical protein
MYCPSASNSTSCYFYNSTLDGYTSHKASCARMGGYLVAYNNADEQLDVESVFTAMANSYTYIGLEKYGNLWYWLDGRFRLLQPIVCFCPPAHTVTLFGIESNKLVGAIHYEVHDGDCWIRTCQSAC